MENIHAHLSVIVTELKRNFSATLTADQWYTVTVMNYNKSEDYIIPALYYERLLEMMEEDRL